MSNLQYNNTELYLTDTQVVTTKGIKVGGASGNEGGQIDFQAAPNSGRSDWAIDLYSSGSSSQNFRFLQQNTSGVGTTILVPQVTAGCEFLTTNYGKAIDSDKLAGMAATSWTAANSIVARDANGEVTANKYFAGSDGTGQNYQVGDDVWIGDVNVSNTMRVSGTTNSAAGYIQFGNADGKSLGRTGAGELTWNGYGFMYSQNAGTVTDLNNLLQSGCYRIQATESNRPTGVDYGNILVMHGGNTDTAAQIVSDYGSNNLYWRSGNTMNTTPNWGSWRRIWTDNAVSFDTGATPNTAVYRNASGNFATNDIVVNGVVYTGRTIALGNGGNKEYLYSDGTYLSLGFDMSYTRVWKPFILNNGTSDSPELIFNGNGLGEWEIDTQGGRLRIMRDWLDKLVITGPSADANESYKFVVPSVYSNTSSSGIAVVVDGDGGIRRQVSSIRYKTSVEDLQKEFVDTFFENARPIYYKDKYPQEGKDWGFWGFIAEEVAEFDKRLVHWRWDGEEVEVTKTKLEHPAEPERTEIVKEEVELEDGTKEVIEKEVVIPAKEATYREYTTKEFQEDRTKPMIAEGVFYDRITVLLTAKVQEQDKEIKALRSELDELKEMMSLILNK